MPVSAEKEARPAALLFDYGGVLSHPQSDSDVQSLARLLGCGIERFLELYWAARLDYDRGALSGRSYWQRIALQAGHEIPDTAADELVKLDAMSWARLNYELVGWIPRIRATGMRLGVVSNMPKEVKQHLLATLDCFSHFDDLTFSCDLGKTKPEAFVFEHSLRALQVRPGQAIFIDDHEANVEGARALGIRSVLYSSNHELAARLSEYGCELPGLGS